MSATTMKGAPAELGLRAAAFRRAVTTGPVFRAFLMAKMPLLGMTGARIEHLDLERGEVRLPYGWLTKNVFGSMYFASTLMAAEAACGSIVLLQNQNRPQEFAPIVKTIEAEFARAAYEDVVFRCDDGDIIADLFERARESGERVEATVTVTGRTSKEEVARVKVTWSARMRDEAV